ncbi:MAG TPA: hypothetical protein VHC20_06205 [Candidatus Paceibacterota bacterium]|nr:hypothetical protein [Candidatus Paceibacterota bacterium]
MPISYVASNIAPAWPGGSANNTSSITITKPTGTVDGDVMIAVIVTGSGAIVSSPAGWQVIDIVDNSSNLKMVTWYKVANGEGASYNFTDDSGNTLPLNGSIQTFRGVDTSSPINTSATATSTTTDPVTTPTVTTTASALLVHVAVSRYATATNIATKGTYAAVANYTIRSNQGNRGSGTQYYGAVMTSSTDAVVSAGSKTGISFDADANHAPTNGIRTQIALTEYIVPVSTNAGNATASVAAYAPASLTVGTAAEYGAVTATANNATVLTGVAAENTGRAQATATAYNAAGWVIHPVNGGAIAFNASVAISTVAEHATASVTLSGGHGYFGAPESRRWRIGAEDRTWRVARESRAWTIPAEDRSWRIPSED